MSGRVIMQRGVDANIRVSMPGYEVTTADQDQLTFDSRFSGFQSFMEGAFLAVPDATYNIPFPFALDKPPLLCLYFDLYYNSSFHQYWGPCIFRGQGLDRWFYAYCTTSELVIQNNYARGFHNVWYKVFRGPSG